MNTRVAYVPMIQYECPKCGQWFSSISLQCVHGIQKTGWYLPPHSPESGLATAAACTCEGAHLPAFETET